MPEAGKITPPDAHLKALEFIEHVTANADVVQRRVLSEILGQNAAAEYLRRHGLSGRAAADPDAFKRLIPVVTYEDLQPDILRVAQGDTSPIFSGRPISEFLTRYFEQFVLVFLILQDLWSQAIFGGISARVPLAGSGS